MSIVPTESIVIPNGALKERSRGIAVLPVEGPASLSGRLRFHDSLRSLGMTTLWFAIPLLLTACEGEEAKTRKRIAADYAIEFDGRPQTDFYVRQVLSLRPDGNWVKTSHSEIKGDITDSPHDSGTFRIQGVTLVLRSLVEPGEPRRYTVSGDTLFNANATKVKAITGYDIGEETLVRVR